MAAALTLSETLFVALEPRPERDLHNASPPPGQTPSPGTKPSHWTYMSKRSSRQDAKVALRNADGSVSQSRTIEAGYPVIPCAGTRRADLRSGGRSAPGGWPAPRSRASCWSMALRPPESSPSRAFCVNSSVSIDQHERQRWHGGVLDREGAQRVGSAAARDLLQRGSMTHPLHHHAQRTLNGRPGDRSDHIRATSRLAIIMKPREVPVAKPSTEQIYMCASADRWMEKKRRLMMRLLPF